MPWLPKLTSFCRAAGSKSVISSFMHIVLTPSNGLLIDTGCVNRRLYHSISRTWWWRWQQQMTQSNTCGTSFSACHLATCSRTNSLHPHPAAPPTLHTATGSDKPFVTELRKGERRWSRGRRAKYWDFWRQAVCPVVGGYNFTQEICEKVRLNQWTGGILKTESMSLNPIYFLRYLLLLHLSSSYTQASTSI